VKRRVVWKLEEIRVLKFVVAKLDEHESRQAARSNLQVKENSRNPTSDSVRLCTYEHESRDESETG
jgi:hypothetical protein